MKVNIGKYPSRLICNIHTDFMNKKYGYLNWPGNQTRFENFLEKVEDIIQRVYNLVNIPFLDRREQKVNVRIDPWDVWSMDSTLAHIVLPMLIQLNDTKQGAPSVDEEDIPEHIRENRCEFDGDFELWDWIIGEIIFAFESKHTDWKKQFQSGNSDLRREKIGDGCSKLIEGPNHTMEYDWEGYKAYQARISNGFRLFGKYYEALWS